MLTSGEASRILGITITTLKNWTVLGYIKAKVTPTGRWMYSEEDIEEFQRTGYSEIKKA